MGKKIDARGMSCPQPVLMAKKALEKHPEVIKILVDNNTACMNIKRFMEHAGYKVIIKEDGEDFTIIGSK